MKRMKSAKNSTYDYGRGRGRLCISYVGHRSHAFVAVCRALQACDVTCADCRAYTPYISPAALRFPYLPLRLPHFEAASPRHTYGVTPCTAGFAVGVYCCTGIAPWLHATLVTLRAFNTIWFTGLTGSGPYRVTPFLLTLFDSAWFRYLQRHRYSSSFTQRWDAVRIQVDKVDRHTPPAFSLFGRRWCDCGSVCGRCTVAYRACGRCLYLWCCHPLNLNVAGIQAVFCWDLGAHCSPAVAALRLDILTVLFPMHSPHGHAFAGALPPRRCTFAPRTVRLYSAHAFVSTALTRLMIGGCRARTIRPRATFTPGCSFLPVPSALPCLPLRTVLVPIHRLPLPVPGWKVVPSGVAISGTTCFLVLGSFGSLPRFARVRLGFADLLSFWTATATTTYLLRGLFKTLVLSHRDRFVWRWPHVLGLGCCLPQVAFPILWSLLGPPCGLFSTVLLRDVVFTWDACMQFTWAACAVLRCRRFPGLHVLPGSRCHISFSYVYAPLRYRFSRGQRLITGTSPPTLRVPPDFRGYGAFTITVISPTTGPFFAVLVCGFPFYALRLHAPLSAASISAFARFDATWFWLLRTRTPPTLVCTLPAHCAHCVTRRLILPGWTAVRRAVSVPFLPDVPTRPCSQFKARSARTALPDVRGPLFRLLPAHWFLVVRYPQALFACTLLPGARAVYVRATYGCVRVFLQHLWVLRVLLYVSFGFLVWIRLPSCVARFAGRHSLRSRVRLRHAACCAGPLPAAVPLVCAVGLPRFCPFLRVPRCLRRCTGLRFLPRYALFVPRDILPPVPPALTNVATGWLLPCPLYLDGLVYGSLRWFVCLLRFPCFTACGSAALRCLCRCARLLRLIFLSRLLPFLVVFLYLLPLCG